MALALDILSWIFLLSGATFAIIAGIGVLRFPDVYTRSHAAGLGDTLATLLVILGLLLQSPDWMVAVKLIMVLAFVWFTSPISGHALVKAAYAHGVKIDCEEEDAVSH
ncbi:MAG: monovalent cation/H(+) antiporter subunit G [Deltaproteobacteria bacterium]|nr:monovalent cation/H(+) antiporter subunit G [Deltaproteobacteria bacterium]